MCIIAIKPKGKRMIDEQTIRTMFANNPHGAGYMYYDYDLEQVVIRKGFRSVDAFIKDINARRLTETNVVLHFRISTSGLIDELNCHPFPIYDVNATFCKTSIGMAHNGILYDYEPPKWSEINDTQVFIRRVIRKLSKGFINDYNCLKLIKELVYCNKLAFLDNNNKVTMIGDFVEDDGYYFSNNSYIEKKRK